MVTEALGTYQTYIPIHTSDRLAFTKCRRKWDWGSPMRRNLVPAPRVHGISENLWFGTGVHYALEAKYDTRLVRDPVEAWIEWFNAEIYGGTTALDNKEHVSLYEQLPFYDEDRFQELFELGKGMLINYEAKSSTWDNFRVVDTEHDFSVPIGIQRIDRRDGIIKPVHLEGRMDLIIQDLSTGRYGILDHKTAAKTGHDYYRKLDMDEQCTTYLVAAPLDAEIRRMEYSNVDFIMYNVLLKRVPAPPKVLERPKGMLSTSRDQGTTLLLWDQAVERLGLQEWAQTNEKAVGYRNYLENGGLDMPEGFLLPGSDMFNQRYVVVRNKTELLSAASRIQDIAHDMTAPDIRTYPNPTSDFWCINCPFRGPCLAKEHGEDYEEMLATGYKLNEDRGRKDVVVDA